MAVIFHHDFFFQVFYLNIAIGNLSMAGAVERFSWQSHSGFRGSYRGSHESLLP